jgi:hypothetical protein
MSSLMRGINEQQIENSLKMTEAEITLWEMKHRTWMHRGKIERAFIADIAIALGIAGHPNSVDYLAAHKAHYEAEGQLMELKIAKLKSEATVFKAMLAEARNPTPLIAGPGGGQVKM